MRPQKIIVIIILGIILHWQINADEIFQTTQKDTFLKTIYTTKEGLPQNTPTGIVKTQDGYLWVGTFGGLARFDGVKFTVFTTSNTPELINNRIVSLYEDRHGVLWIGSEDGDIVNYQNGTFSLIKKSEGPPKDTTVASMYMDKNDLLWIVTSKELRTYDTKTKQFTTYPTETLLQRRLSSSSAQTFNQSAFHFDFVKPDPEGNLWFGTNEGLIKYSNGVFTDFNTEDGLPDNHVYSMAFNQEGGFWVSNSKMVGLFKNGTFTKLVEIDYDGDFSLLAVNQDNHLFFASKKYLFEIIGNEIIKYDITDVGTDGIRALYFGKQGNLWLAGNIGLLNFKRRNINVFAIKDDNILAGVASIIGTPDKDVWAATGHYLLRWRQGNLSIISNHTTGAYFVSLATDKNNTIWAGTFNGIYKYQNGELTRTSIVPEKTEITPIFVDRDGKLWFCRRDQGIYEYHNGNLKLYTTADGLANNWASQITQDRSGTIWIATKGGLSRLSDGRFTNYTTENGLVNNNVRDFFEDEEGTVWIGTYGGGISRLKNGKIVSITSDNGLAENIASRMLLDDYGIFWVLGNQGIYTVSKKSLNDFADGITKRVYCTIYDEKDGMIIAEGSGGNQPAGWKASDGKLWFPMIKGGVIINPIRPNKIPAPVFVEEVFLNRERVNPQKKLEIQPGQENLEINYTAVSFSKPEQIQFRYKLEDYDSDWQDVGTRRVAYYPYLPPGTYTFRVMATNGNDVWSETPASLEIVVHAPFWRTWWFLALSILALVLLIIFIYQWRLANLEKKRQLQQDFSRRLINAHESERNRIAGELHDSLGHELLIIKNWSLLAIRNISNIEKTKTQLEEISETATRALEETRAIARNLRPQYLQKLGLTETLEIMARQVEDSAGISVQTEIKNIDSLFTEEDQLGIFRLVQEILNNMVKHSEATQALIRVRHHIPSIDITNAQEKIEIFISDNGKGFDLNKKRKNSFGLENLEQRTALIGGTYQIKSSSRNGTQTTIWLDIDKKEKT